MFKGGSLWRPPPVNPYTQGMPEELVVDTGSTKKGQLSERQDCYHSAGQVCCAKPKGSICSLVK